MYCFNGFWDINMYLVPLTFCVIVAGPIDVSSRFLNYNVCEKDICREIGKHIQSGINISIDPCTNFYDYGCGSWSINNPIPPSELQWSADDLQVLKTNRRVKELLETESEYDELPPIKKLKQYYHSCLDEDTIERNGLIFITKLLNLNGGWPIIIEETDNNLKDLTWQEIDNTYNELFGYSSFFKISYEPDELDSTHNILTISIDNNSFMEKELNEEDKQLFDTNVIKMTRIIKIFARYKGIKVEKIRMREIIKIYRFGEKFNDIIKKSHKQTLKGLESNKTRMTISELQEYYDSAKTSRKNAKINWLKIIQYIYSGNVSIDSSEPIVIYNKEFLHELAYLLEDTSQRVLVNYIQWNVVNGLIPYLNKELRDITFESSHKEYNVTKQKSRWETCVEDIPLRDALSYLYIKKYNLTNNMKAVTEIVEEIKTELKERILYSKWMNDNTKEFMIAKMDNLILQIGYPKWYNNQTALIERHEGLLVKDNYLQNYLNNLIYKKKKFIMKFREPVDKYEWIDSPLTKNSFYDALTNRIIIPIAEIQDPFFTPYVPLAFNYGGVGTIVAHELAHSFDRDGMMYDKFGNKYLRHSKETNKAYEQRIKCFVDQYNNFTYHVTDDNEESIQVNGLLTRDENIADNIGLEVAFAAFQKRLLTAGPQSKLPGFTNITNEQLFFLSYVNAWCATSRKCYEEDNVNIDTHTPPRFRIIGSMANMKSFSDAFNCPVNSSMNRKSKCNLWK